MSLQFRVSIFISVAMLSVTQIGMAAAECTANCAGKVCQDDGCGGICDCFWGICVGGSCYGACSGIPEPGCCEGGDTLHCDPYLGGLHYDWCETDQPCGWSVSLGKYACGGELPADPAGVFLPTCAPDCSKNCIGKECGSNGCMGVCGTCPSGYWCENGKCCLPDCTGKECGDNGCGGSCGTCEAGCIGGKCYTSCSGITQKGCCDGNVIVRCDPAADYLLSGECISPQYCGWSSAHGFYKCGGDLPEDPSGTYPRECNPDCSLNCQGKECGSDG
jgi:hypothetical protein